MTRLFHACGVLLFLSACEPSDPHRAAQDRAAQDSVAQGRIAQGRIAQGRIAQENIGPEGTGTARQGPVASSVGPVDFDAPLDEVDRDARRTALVIGNGAYDALGRLDNPKNDAQLMAETLEALGFQVQSGGPLTDLDAVQMRRAVAAYRADLAARGVSAPSILPRMPCRSTGATGLRPSMLRRATSPTCARSSSPPTISSRRARRSAWA